MTKESGEKVQSNEATEKESIKVLNILREKLRDLPEFSEALVSKYLKPSPSSVIFDNEISFTRNGDEFLLYPSLGWDIIAISKTENEKTPDQSEGFTIDTICDEVKYFNKADDTTLTGPEADLKVREFIDSI